MQLVNPTTDNLDVPTGILIDGSIFAPVILVDPDTGLPTSIAGGGGGGSTDVSTLNKEATQQLIKSGVDAIKGDTAAIKVDADSIKTDIAAIKAVSGFYSTGYTLNAAGDIASESESNGTVTRTRTWTYVTNPDGSVVASASAWSIA